MEYGTFLMPHANWILILSAIAAAGLCAVFISLAIKTESAKNSKISIWGKRSGENNNGVKEITALSIVAAVLSFIAIWPLLTFGVLAGTSPETWGGNSAGSGKYLVVESSLLFKEKYLYDENGYALVKRIANMDYYARVPDIEEPVHFFLKLESFDQSQPALSRYFEIPYKKVVNGNSYLPSNDALLNRKFLYDSEKRKYLLVPVTVPSEIIKYPNGLWKFTEEKEK